MSRQNIKQSKPFSRSDLQTMGREVLDIEARVLAGISSGLDESFAIAIEYLLACTGRVVVLGVGKSGHIGSKIAATLASTGTPAFFVHAGEASHGDMGMIVSTDVVMAISNSGETSELTVLLPLIKRLGVKLVSMTGSDSSSLARASTIHLHTKVLEEACPLGLAPTSSTTAALAIGDALAVTLLQARGFTEADFAKAHPGGALGRRLLVTVEDIMHSGAQMPVVCSGIFVSEALREISKAGLGVAAVLSPSGDVVGVFTDGDLRRMIDAGHDLRTTVIDDCMTKDCKTVAADVLAAEALNIMQNSKINALLVTGSQGELVGVLNMHDLLLAKVF
jgi:arabinose-5-phosphate isomerase